MFETDGTDAMFSFPHLTGDREVMTTAAEYRAWVEESLKWASESMTTSERDAHIKTAETWLQCALLSERHSREPIPAAEYEWILPPFQEWRNIALHSQGERANAEPMTRIRTSAK